MSANDVITMYEDSVVAPGGALHDLKTDPEVFQLSKDGLKDWEIRFNDRDFKVGDVIQLRKTKFSGNEMSKGLPLVYTKDVLVREITAVVSGYGLQEGWVILSVKELS
ncbi:MULTISPECIES: DUF3850 domain-containing protein [unclassified Neptuniibacter]|uniref:DUF3850 domain-containing protein n=1 Tax=unclassified Neptuniibacter TaxID=2630693 RepID=UPI0025EEABF9|nr:MULTISPECIES: DUF3850 domain-containing protein [unclassified Neptuniibacter]|tara:strand:- start:3812 stop:4135 length:324 start_codon:yes stop_codon:yes gene_type:complete